MKHLESGTLKLREDVTLVSIGDKAALLDVEKRCYFDPNDMAFFLLELVDSGCPYEQMAVELVSRFDVAAETARLDIDRFVTDLLRLGLVEAEEEATASVPADRPKKAKQAYYVPLLEPRGDTAVICAPESISPI